MSVSVCKKLVLFSYLQPWFEPLVMGHIMTHHDLTYSNSGAYLNDYKFIINNNFITTRISINKRKWCILTDLPVSIQRVFNLSIYLRIYVYYNL